MMTVFDVAETLIMLLFVFVQVSMVWFLLQRGRKEQSFRQAFYVFFIAITIVDCIVVVGNRALYYAEVCFHDHEAVWRRSSPALRTFMSLLMKVLNHVIHVGANYQPLGHTVIAVNRFTAVVMPFKHSLIWRRRAIVIGMVGTTVAAIMLGVVPTLLYYVVKALNSGNKPDGSVLIDTGATMLGFVRPANLVLSCLVGLLLNLATVAMIVVYYRRASESQHGQRGQEVRLFVHSLFMFTIQAYLAFYTFVETTDIFGLFEHYNLPVGAPAWVPKWLQLWSPAWLAGDASCEPDIDYVTPGEGPQYCGTLYAILAGFLNIVGDLSVANLAEYLFALSGAPFLLIVSGKVRRAYCAFYFERLERQPTTISRITATDSSLFGKRSN